MSKITLFKAVDQYLELMFSGQQHYSSPLCIAAPKSHYSRSATTGITAKGETITSLICLLKLSQSATLYQDQEA